MIELEYFFMNTAPTHHLSVLIWDYLAGKKSQNKNFDNHIRTI
jgi:hypothetical protein